MSEATLLEVLDGLEDLLDADARAALLDLAPWAMPEEYQRTASALLCATPSPAR